MNKKKLGFSLVILLMLSNLQVLAYAQSLTVNTEEDGYYPGDTVTVYGDASVYHQVEVIITRAWNPQVTYMRLHVSASRETGVYEAVFVLPTDAQIGEYIVTASCNREVVQTRFEILDKTNQLPPNLLLVLEASYAQALSILTELSESTGVPDEAWDVFEEGRELMLHAKDLINEEEFSEASSFITEAMSLFSQATQIALEYEPETVVRTEPEIDEELIELEAAIRKALDYLESIKETSNHLQDQGYDQSHVQSLLDDAEELLLQALELLEIGEKSRARTLKDEALDLVHQAKEQINTQIQEKKKEKAAKFLANTQERLEQLRERILKLLNSVPGTDPDSVNEAFALIMSKILEIDGLIESGDLDQALDEFDWILGESEDALDELDDINHERREILWKIEKLEARTSNLLDTIHDLGEWGLGVGDAENLVRKIRGTLQQAVESLEQGELDDAKDLINEAQELLNDLEDLIHRLKEELKGVLEEEREIKEEVEYEEIKAKAHKLHDLIATLRELSTWLHDEGMDTSSVDALLDSSEELIEETMELIEIGEFYKAKANLIEVENLTEYAEKKIHEIKKAMLEAVEINQLIDELVEQINKYRNRAKTKYVWADELSELEIDVSNAYVLLDEVMDLLEEAEDLLEDNIDEADNLVNEAKDKLARAGSMLEGLEYQIDYDDVVAKLLALIEEYEGEVDSLEDWAHELDEAGADVSTVYWKLETAWELLQAARGKVEDYPDKAEAKIQSAREYLDHAINILEDIEESPEENHDIAELLALIEEYEEEADSLEGWAHELDEAGADVSTVYYKIGTAWDLLQEARTKVEDYPDKAELKIQSASEYLRHARNLLEDLEASLDEGPDPDLVLYKLGLIEEAEAEHESLEAWAHELAEADMDISGAAEYLGIAWNLLQEARSIVETNPHGVPEILDHVEYKHGIVRNILMDLGAELEEHQAHINECLEVIEDYESAIDSKEAWMHELQESGAVVTEIISSLEEAWSLLQDARDIVEESPELVEPILADVIGILEDVHEQLEALQAELDEHEAIVAVWLEVIEAYEAEVDTKEAWAHELGEAGMEVSEILVSLGDAWSMLQEARSIVEETPELVEPMIAEVNELLDALHLQLEALQDEHDAHVALVNMWLEIIEEYEVEANGLGERADVLHGEAIDVSDVYALLDEAWGLLEDARSVVEETPESVEAIISQVNQKLDLAHTILTDLETP